MLAELFTQKFQFYRLFKRSFMPGNSPMRSSRTITVSTLPKQCSGNNGTHHLFLHSSHQNIGHVTRQHFELNGQSVVFYTASLSSGTTWLVSFPFCSLHWLLVQNTDSSSTPLILYHFPQTYLRWSEEIQILTLGRSPGNKIAELFAKLNIMRSETLFTYWETF